MDSGIFLEKSASPTAPALAGALGVKASLWRELKQAIADQHPPITEEWVFAGKTSGWSLRLTQKKRAVVYLTPCARGFRASFAFGEKAVRAAHRRALPASVLRLIDEAPKYVEGRAVRIAVKRAADVRQVIELAAIKMSN